MMEENKIRQPKRLIGMFPMLEMEIDDVDAPPRKLSTTCWDLFSIATTIVMHIVDMAIDLNLAIRYFLAGKVASSVWTMAFIFLPSLANVVISRRIHYQDKKARPIPSRLKESRFTDLMLENKFCAMLMVVFQLAPVLRYYQTLKYAWKSKKCAEAGDKDGQRHYYIKMLKEDQDVALLRVFECFLEAAPQQVLQITLLLRHYHNTINLEFVHQVASILSSLGSMGWAMASYHRSIRLAQMDKKNIGKTGFLLQLSWHFFITVSRILSLSITASIWPIYTGVACICHWMCMLVWIMIDSHGILEFCRDYANPPHVGPKLKERIYSVLFSLVLGIVHVFIYLNPVDGKTFFKHIFFYVVCFLENVGASTIWMFTASHEVRSAWYFNVLIILSIVPFLLGVIAMVIYYLFFHPNNKTEKPLNFNVQEPE